MASMVCDVLVIGHDLPALVAMAAAGGCLLPGREIRRVVRRGRSISAITLDHGEIGARFFVDDLEYTERDLIATPGVRLPAGRRRPSSSSRLKP